MPSIHIVLPTNRSLCGNLTLLADDGSVICGPFAVAGRSSDALAAAHGNASRRSTLPYGDTPTGEYRVSKVAFFDPGEAEASGRRGEPGELLIDPTAGDAAIAEANGRYCFRVRGGRPGPDGSFLSTAGALRMDDDDLAKLLDALARSPGTTVECVEDDSVTCRRRVIDDPSCREIDPPLFGGAMELGEQKGFPIGRRGLLQGGAAITGSAWSGAVTFFSLQAAPAFAQTAYPPPEPQPETDQPPSDTGEDTKPDETPQSDDKSDTNEQPDAKPEAESEEAAPTPTPNFSEPLVEVDAAAPPENVVKEIAKPTSEIATKLKEFVRDEGGGAVVDALKHSGGAAGEVLGGNYVAPWVKPAAEVVGALTGAAQLAISGQSTSTALNGLASALKDAAPDVISSGVAIAIAPEFLETTVAVGAVAGALGFTMPAVAIGLTSILIVAGANKAIGMVTEKAVEGYSKLGEVAIEYFRSEKK